MAEYVIQDSTLTSIGDAIREKTGGSSAMTPAEMVTAIEGIETGATITDGIVYTSVDADGFPLTADYYTSSGAVPAAFFYPGYAPSSWADYLSSWHKKLQTLIIKNKVTVLNELCFVSLKANIVGDFSEVTVMPGNTNSSAAGTVVFAGSYVENLSFDSLRYFTGSNLQGCEKLKTVYAPKCQNIYSKWDAGASRATFGNCTALQNVQLGSVGFPCFLVNDQIFLGCTQSGLTITLYTIGANVDTQVTRIRNGATNATIIIKASEATEYNGTSYTAGDTILTSEVEQT